MVATVIVVFAAVVVGTVVFCFLPLDFWAFFVGIGSCSSCSILDLYLRRSTDRRWWFSFVLSIATNLRFTGFPFAWKPM